MCKPCAKNIDCRSNHLLLQKFDQVLLTDDASHEASENDVSPGLISRQLVEQHERQCVKPQEGTKSNKLDLILRFAIVGILLLACIQNHFESIALEKKMEEIRIEMSEFNARSNEGRTKRRIRKANDHSNKEALRQVLNSYEISFESELAQDIEVALNTEFR